MHLLINAGNASVAVADGLIVAPEGRFDVVLEMPSAEVRPGLINAHDHLHRNHYGQLGAPHYPNARAWALDIQNRHSDHIAEHRLRPRREALEVGAWKNLFSGVTTVVHHDAWEAAFEDDFPLRVLKIRNADSLSMESDLHHLHGQAPFCIHLAEGVDEDAASEVRRLSELGLLTDNLIAVHCVGVDGAAVERFRRSGAAVVWCPSSNLFLLGRTAPSELLAEGVDVLLGSDSRLTGAGDLLDELRCARAIGSLDDLRLEAAVGATAARRLGVPKPSLALGAVADLIVLQRPLLDARSEDVALVMAGGVLRVARPDVASEFGEFADLGASMRIGSLTRWTTRAPANQKKSHS